MMVPAAAAWPPWGTIPVLLRKLVASMALTTALLGAACDGGGGSTTPKVQLWTMQLKPTFEAYVGERLKAWEAKHPGTTVDWVDVPGKEVEQKALAAMASGSPPDLINLNPNFATKLAQAQGLRALQVDAATKGLYLAAAWEACTVGGEVVGYPWYLTTPITLINTERWAASGNEVGKYPTRYEELAKLAVATQKAGKGPLWVPNLGEPGKVLELLAGDGVALVSADGKHAAFNTPEGAASLAFWGGLLKQGGVPREALTLGHREALDRFQAGQTAIFVGGASLLKALRENAPGLVPKLAVAPAITGKAGAVGLGVMNLVVPRAAAQPALAEDLARHLTSAESQLAFCKLVPILPSALAAASDPYFKAGGPDLEAKARVVAAGQLATSRLVVPPLPHQQELQQALDQALQEVALGKKEAAAALADAAKAIDAVLASP